MDSQDFIDLCTAFVNQQGTTNTRSIVDSVDADNDGYTINYSWARGSETWFVTREELFSWAWANPKQP